jgi:hypothetical protein
MEKVLQEWAVNLEKVASYFVNFINDEILLIEIIFLFLSFKNIVTCYATDPTSDTKCDVLCH